VRRQYEADDLTVRRSLTFLHGFAVDVHRGTDARVAHEFRLIKLSLAFYESGWAGAAVEAVERAMHVPPRF